MVLGSEPWSLEAWQRNCTSSAPSSIYGSNARSLPKLWSHIVGLRHYSETLQLANELLCVFVF